MNRFRTCARSKPSQRTKRSLVLSAMPGARRIHLRTGSCSGKVVRGAHPKGLGARASRPLCKVTKMVALPGYSQRQIALFLNQAKTDATDVDNLFREATSTTFGGGQQTRAVCDHEIQAAESCATAVGIFDEANAGIIQG